MTVSTRWDPLRDGDHWKSPNRLFANPYSPEGPEEALMTTSFAPPHDETSTPSPANWKSRHRRKKH